MELSDLRTRMARWLADGYSAVVFEIDEGIAAYALYRNTDSDSEGSDGIYLRQFFVDRERRRSGIGREAMRLLFEEVWPRDRRIVLEVLATNPGGRAFWSSLGFREHSTGLEFTAQMRSRSKETT